MVALSLCGICIVTYLCFFIISRLRLEPYDNFASWSPDGQRIAYSCLRRERAKDRRPGVHFGPYAGYDQNRLGEICVVDSDGSNRVQLTDNQYPDDFPVWSPDGRQIAYVSKPEDGGAGIYLSEVDTWNPVNVTQNPGSYWSLDWSPSGEYLTFVRFEDGSHQPFILRLRDGKMIPLAPQRDGYFDDLAWSPNSEFVAYIVGDWDRSDYNEVHIVSISDMEIEPITHDSTTRYANLIWSPDGQHIAYSVYRPKDTYPRQVCILDIETASETGILEAAQPLREISLSPDGRFLSYLEGEPEGRLHIWDRTEGDLLVSYDVGQLVIASEWAPDGYQVLVNRFDDWNRDGYTEPKLWVLDIVIGEMFSVSGGGVWNQPEQQLNPVE